MKKRGFTLAEVLIALAVFLMAAVVLGGAYMNVLISYDIAEKDSVTNADIVFARALVLREPNREKVEEGGQFEAADGGTVNWSAEIESTNMPDLFRVTLTCEVSNKAGGEPEKHQESFVVLRPTWSSDVDERTRLQEETRAKIRELQEAKL